MSYYTTPPAQGRNPRSPAALIPPALNSARSLLLRYGVALVSAALAVLIRGLLTPLWGNHLPFSTLYPAVLVSAWYGGLGPGLVTTALCATASAYFWLDPVYTLAISYPADQIGLALAVLVMLLITWLTAALRHARETLEQRVQERTAELAKANASLASERALLMTTLEQLPVGVIITDTPSGETFLANGQAKQIWRYETLPSPSFADIVRYQGFYPDGRRYQGEDWPLQRALRTGETVTGEEIRFIRGDDARGVMEISAAPVRDANGRTTAAVVVFTDITARKKMEEALRTLNAELDQRVQERTADLERTNADLRQVAYVSAHDLQEPVRQMGLYTQKLAKRYRDALDAETQEAVGFIVEAAQRMVAQFTDLTHYLEVDEQGPGVSTTDCEEVWRRILEVLQDPITASGATITHDPLPTLAANAAQLQLVFQELLDNALKFRNSAPPLVHVRAEREERGWRFAVRDNGIGIDPQLTGQLFGFFRRLHPRQQYPGTGMGLAICRKIVERHGGRIWVESQPGQGATFLFTISEKSSQHGETMMNYEC